MFSQFIYAYRNVGNAPKEQEYIEKSIEFEKKGFSDIEIQMKHREDLAKCLLKQGKFKYASTALEQANKLRDELGSQKPVKKREQEKDFVGKGFDDPFPNMSEDDYIGTLEFKFRNLIMNKLMKLPNWEKERVPPKEWQAAIELKKTSESDPVLLDHEKRIIDYVDFSDYIKIFQHKKNWDKIFQPVFRDSDLFFGQLKILQKFRNPIAHHRGNKLRRHLSEPAHGQLEQIYNYFMLLMQRDEDRKRVILHEQPLMIT